MLDFVKSHWGWITTVGVAVLTAICTAIVRRFGDPDNDPATPPRTWVKVFMVIADLLSWLPKPGHTSLLGPVSAPLLPSRKPDEPDTNVKSILLFVLVSAAASACAGWKAPTYSTLTAVVKQATDARDKLPDLCKKTFEREVDGAKTREEAKTLADKILKQCQTAWFAADAVVDVAKMARDGINDTGTFLKDPKAIAAYAVAALNAYKNLTDLLAPFGVSLPEVK